MKTLTTFRFWLAPDKKIPRFKRLHWEEVPVPVADVLTQGIHPWMGAGHCPSLADAVLERINRSETMFAELGAFRLCYDVYLTGTNLHGSYDGCKFQSLLEELKKTVYFVEDITFLELLQIAKERLLERWDDALAGRLLSAAFYHFADLRRFLKQKDPRITLRSYSDLNHIRLGEVLSLEDFAAHDTLLLHEGLPSHNFRRERFLEQIADASGRLRLVPEIKEFLLYTRTEAASSAFAASHVNWRGECTGSAITVRPQLGAERVTRKAAAAIAEKWRTNEGRLVFQTDLERLAALAAAPGANLVFPTLNYTQKINPPNGDVVVDGAAIAAYKIGVYVTLRSTCDVLRDVLYEHGAPVAGNKEQLLKKLAKLTAKRYEEHLETLDAYFSAQRFIRIRQNVGAAEEFHLVNDLRYVHNLVVAVYALKHLRGNTILEAGYVNDTYTAEQVAYSLLIENVKADGAFLRAA